MSKSKKKDTLKYDKPKYPNQQLNFIVNMPPSKNHGFFYKGGKKIPNSKTKKYKEITRKQISKEIRRQKWKKDNPNVWYYLDLFFYFPDRRRRDSHNFIEILMDTLEGVLFTDDYFVMPRVQLVTLDRENPRLEGIISAKKY